jgi:hypothetical protein
MPRNFVALNIALAAVSAVLIAYIVRQVLAPTPLPAVGRRATVATATASPAEPPRTAPGAYGVVPARNLFSPTRTEAPTSTTTASAVPLVRPNLYGIVVREGGSIAYLEDPLTKRVVGYRVGDKIVGGTVQTIKADGVVIERPEGPMDVRLRDPGKPRAVPAATQPGVPPMAQPGVQPGAALPGVIPPAASPAQPVPPQLAQPPQMPQPPVQPGFTPPGQTPGVMPPGVRRSLPPNLLRRVPPGLGDAPQQ